MLAPLVLFWLLSAGAESCARERVASIGELLFTLDKVRAELEEAPPTHLSDSDWRVFDAAEAKIRRLLQDRASVDELGVDERIELLNAQERLVAIVSGAQSDRVTCRRDRRTGSHFLVATCVNAAESRADREAAQQLMQRISEARIR